MYSPLPRAAVKTIGISQSLSSASRHMDILNLWLPLIGGGLLCAIAIGAWFGDQRPIAIWFGFAGLVCLLLLAALQLQEHETASGHVKDDPARPWVGILEVNVRPVQIGNSLETTIVYINSGLSPAQNLRVYAHAQNSASYRWTNSHSRNTKGHPTNITHAEGHCIRPCFPRRPRDGCRDRSNNHFWRANCLGFRKAGIQRQWWASSHYNVQSKI